MLKASAKLPGSARLSSRSKLSVAEKHRTGLLLQLLLALADLDIFWSTKSRAAFLSGCRQAKRCCEWGHNAASHRLDVLAKPVVRSKLTVLPAILSSHS